MNPNAYRVDPALLRSSVDLSHLPFETTEDVASLDATIGQDRAVKALSFGLRMRQKGYNIYASGRPGTGKSTLIRRVVRQLAQDGAVPCDWCYVHNFQHPECPRGIQLPAGEGREFQHEMNELVLYLKAKVPEVFQSKDYIEQRDQIIERGNRRKQALFEEVVNKGRDLGFEIKSTRTGFSFKPMRQGKPLGQEEAQRLSVGEQKKIEEGQRVISDYLRDLLLKFQELDKETEETLQTFNHEATNFTIEARFKTLQDKYKNHAKIVQYLKDAYADVLRNFRDFLPSSQPELALLTQAGNHEDRHYTRYRVNLLVDHAGAAGAPVIEETNPTYPNLVGRIEKRARLGTLQTDFTMIRAGALLKASGGYLLLHVLDLLTHPLSWEALKKTITKNELAIEDLGELYGVLSVSGLKPEPIPVDLKVVVIGSSYIYSLLQLYDEDFGKLFKVKADFNTRTQRSEEEMTRYVQFAAKVCREENLMHLDRGGVIELLNQITRMVDHKERLSLQFNEVASLIREAAFWASEEGASIVSARHVEKARQEQVYRSNLMEERIQEEIDEEVLMLDVAGEKVGQVNGLVVYSVGDYSFGKPSRITSRTYLGRKGVINIEREVELSGKTHSKGVMILSNYLGGRYAQEHPLSLSASVAFEQSYSEVDGDSASAAELIAILSSLAGVPVRQNLAITGSINQHGEMQPIGGVNEKIEGFFQTCRNRSLTGAHGVIIPHQNVQHLCLTREVVDAVKEGLFHVYEVKQMDEAVALLTGLDAGEVRADGTFPPGTFNALVQAALGAMHEKLEENDRDEGEESDEA